MSTERKEAEERDDEDSPKKVLDRNNLNRAYKRVKVNKDASGMDEMTVDEALSWLVEHRDELFKSARNGNHNSSPERRAEITKDNGDVRKLGIPPVINTRLCEKIQ